MNDAGWITVALATVAMIGAGISGLFTWLTRRDSLRHDGELIKVNADLAACKDKHAEQEAKNLTLDAINSEQNLKLQGLKSTVADVAAKVENGH